MHSLNKLLFSAVALSVLALLPTSHDAQAAPEKQIIDVAHSTLDFTAESFLIDAEGTFKSWRGDVNLDRENLANSSVYVVVNASSIDTRIDKRDNHLKGEDFLDVAKYPTIVFKSSSVTPTGDKSFNLTGELSLHGVTRTLTIPVTIDRLQDNYSRFRGVFTISRSAFGIEFNSKLNPIKDELKIELVINLKKPE